MALNFGNRPKFTGGYVLNQRTGKVVHYGEGFRIFPNRSALDEFLAKAGGVLGEMTSTVKTFIAKEKP